jgi:hypothetical protein
VPDLLRTFLEGSLDLLLKVLIIVVPIMVVLELFEGSRPFRALVRGWARLTSRLGMTEKTAIPTLVGFLFGLAYGGGVIIRETKRHELERRQVFLMDVFLSQVHAIVEDSLVFIVVGASVLWVVGFRLVWAIAVTAVLGAAATGVARRRRARAAARPAAGEGAPHDDPHDGLQAISDDPAADADRDGSGG